MTEILTLVGRKQARLGYKFRFIGSAEECKNCKESLKNICLNNLDKHYVYEVIEIRNIHHECIVHKDGVTVVKVKITPITIVLPSKNIFEGSTIQYQPIRCNNSDCSLFEYCVPFEFDNNKKIPFKIIKIKEKKKNFCKTYPDLTLIEVINV